MTQPAPEPAADAKKEGPAPERQEIRLSVDLPVGATQYAATSLALRYLLHEGWTFAGITPVTVIEQPGPEVKTAEPPPPAREYEIRLVRSWVVEAVQKPEVKP